MTVSRDCDWRDSSWNRSIPFHERYNKDLPANSDLIAAKCKRCKGFSLVSKETGETVSCSRCKIGVDHE